MSAAKCPSLPKDTQKPCIVTFHSQNDRANEPPPQPRVRKVTTVINTLGIVVRNASNEIGVWVMTACMEKSFPKTKRHMFMDFHLGTWIIVGIYPDGTVASFSPWSLSLKAYETSTQQENVYIKRVASELLHEKTVSYGEVISPNNFSPYPYERDPHLTAELYLIPGFGRVLGPSAYRQCLEDSRENASFWIQYCGGVMGDCSWVIHRFDNNKQVDGGFSDKDLRDISDLIRERHITNDLDPIPSNAVSRHFGIVTEVFNQKHVLHCWSPQVSMETDHSARIPQPPKQREIESPMLPPLIGQWIQFDVRSKDMEEYMRLKTGYRLSIQEYLPINSPSGIGVYYANKAVRTAISCILVKSTDHPMLYYLPLFGFVIDRNASLVSGAHMQIILEKTTTKMRRTSGVCWRVIESVIVNVSDVTVEKIKDMFIEIVPIRDAMDVSHLIPTEKSASLVHSKTSAPPSTTSTVSISANSGITSLKYQHTPHLLQYQEPRRDFFIGKSVQMHSNYHSTRNGRYPQKQKTWPTYTGEKLEGCALVEKKNVSTESGILWFFENKNFSIHFIYDNFDLHVGDYAVVKLEQKLDPLSPQGFRWKWLSGTKIKAPFKCHSEKNQIHVNDQLTYTGQDRFKRNIYQSKNFPIILDFDGLIKNPTMGVTYLATIHRRKVANGMQSELAKFYWIVSSVQNNPHGASSFFAPQNTHHQSFIPRQFSVPSTSITEFQRTATSSDGSSSKSPPLKSVSPPSAE